MSRKLDEKLLKEISEILTVQSAARTESRKKLDENIFVSKEIEKDFDEILAQQNKLLADLRHDKNHIPFSSEEIDSFIENTAGIREKHTSLEFDATLLETVEIRDDWDENLQIVRKYAADHNIDLSNPFFNMFSKTEVIQMNHQLVEHFDLCRLDKIDYCIATASGIIAGIIDIVLVGTVGSNTKSSVLQDKVDKVYDSIVKRFAVFERIGELENRKNSILLHAPDKKDKIADINAKIKEVKNWDKKRSISYLEKIHKVSYDISINKNGKTPWLNPSNHHLFSLAHEPSIFGLIIGIIDQISGMTTLISPETGGLVRVVTKKTANSDNIIKKIIESTQNWFGHLISDVAGSKTSKGRGLGLPVPGWAALQKLQFGSFEINGKSLNIAEVSEWMFQNGYDVRAFTAQLIPVIINETLIRTYWILKQHFYYGQSINESMPSASRREVDRLLLVSSAVFSTLDIGDAFIKSQTSSKPGGATGTFLMTMNIPELAAFGLHAVQNVRNEVKHRRYIENLIDTDIEEEWLRIMEN